MSSDQLDAERAIYIDFESLKEDPPRPGLLGVLTAGHPDRFEQLVLDPVLRGAAKAKSHCRALGLPEAIAEIVTRAEQGDRSIVGWSLFERTVIEKAELQAPLKAGFVARYVNGRQIATRWRSRIHPNVQLPRDGPFDTRNRLDRFAELTRYPHLTALQGSPAKWLRRVTQQMGANGGRYRRLTSSTKDVWRRLLLYNEHDCRALRHAVTRAACELEKWKEYELTRFCVLDAPRRRFCFTVGSTNRDLERLLERHGVDRWAFIAAWNPKSTELPREENDRRQTQLRSRLANYIVIPGEGVGRDVNRAPAPSLLVLGIRRKDAIRMGRDFGQLAIVVGHKGFPARLLPCSPLPKPSWARAAPADAPGS
jgi:hypothetical protein